MKSDRILVVMEELFKKLGLDYDLIVSKYPNINEYIETLNAYLLDEFFVELKSFLEDEDYAMAKDATKGLYILASDLCVFPLYETLLEIYEDLQYETYDQVLNHYQEMIKVYNKIRSSLNA